MMLKKLAMLAVLAVGFLVGSAGVTEAQDRRVRIVNESNVTIREFYATNTSRNDWGHDLLGANVLPPGYNIVINFNDGTGACLFDFRAVTMDGRVFTRGGVNVCQISTYTYR